MSPIGEALQRRCAIDPGRPALVAPDDGLVLSFGQLASLAARLVEACPPGRRTVALYTGSRVAQAAVLASGLLAGCVVCPIDPGASPQVVAALVRHSGATLVVSDDPVPDTEGVRALRTSALLASLSASGSAAATGDGGLLVYTSGSTGDPKGVLLREPLIGANVAFAVDHFGYDESWVTGSVLPLFHTFSVIHDLLTMLACGGHVVITPGFSIARLKVAAAAFVEHGVRSYAGVPIIFDMMMAMRFPLPHSMEFAVQGAAPLGEGTRTRYAAKYGHPILPCYGLTETTCFATVSSPDAVRPGSVGRPAGIEADVLDEHGASVPRGQTGEITLRGPSVLTGGYHELLGKHADVFAADGWFRTGDLGRMDADGFVYITGRKKNMLIRGGEKVYLEDVDRCLEEHPAVAECCAVRLEAVRHEDQAVAFIVPADGEMDAAQLAAHVIASLGPLSHVDDFVCVESIPRSGSGKPLRKVLLQGYRS